MRLLEVSAFMENDGSIYKVDAIEYEGAIWLVPHWIEFLHEGVMKPTRIVRLDRLVHQKVGVAGSEYIVNEPLPKSLFETRKPEQIPARYVVIESPDITVSIPK